MLTIVAFVRQVGMGVLLPVSTSTSWKSLYMVAGVDSSPANIVYIWGHLPR